MSIPLGHGSGARIPAATRVRPLPDVALARGVYSGESLAPALSVPPRQTLRPDTETAVTELLRGISLKGPVDPALQVLRADRVETGGSERYILKTIVEEIESGGDLTEAEEALESYLWIRRSPDIEARAHYYLGQVLFARRRHADALIQFLYAADLYYVETRPWIDACLTRLAFGP